MDKFRIGIIGAGHIAEKMAVTLAGMPEVEAYGIASRDRAKAEDFAERFSFSKAFGSYAELADDSNVDLIYVATPHTFHFEHVFCPLRGECKFENIVCHPEFESHISKAEKRILERWYRGESKEEIADALFLSIHTINNHIRNAFQRLNIHNKAEFVRFADSNNLFK